MIVLINSDNNLDVHESYQAQLKDVISEELTNFDEHTNRIEVHLSDQNSSKESDDDKRCLIEDRLKGRQPVAEIDAAKTYDQAVNGAIDKLNTLLETILGRIRNH